MGFLARDPERYSRLLHPDDRKRYSTTTMDDILAPNNLQIVSTRQIAKKTTSLKKVLRPLNSAKERPNPAKESST
jgi:hypothetical protein